jgi:hypothetical protein
VHTRTETPVERDAGPTQEPASASRIVDAYLTAFYSGDFGAARSVVTHDFSFSGPFIQVDGRDAFFDGAAGLRTIVRGHRLVRQWEDDDDVCSLYEFHIETQAGAGSVLASEWHTARNGRLTSGRLIFDSSAFRALMPRPGA